MRDGGRSQNKNLKMTTPFLLSLVLIKQKKIKTQRDIRDVATEAEGRRELTQDGVLPMTAGGWTLICTKMGRPHRLPCRTVPPALARGC